MNQLKKLLEQTKLTAETIDVIIRVIKGLGIAVLVFLITWSILTAKAEQREQQYLERMRVFKEQAEAASKYADSLAVEEAKYKATADSARRRADMSQRDANRSKVATARTQRELDSLKRVITDSVEMARVIIPKQDTVIKQQQVTIAEQDTTIFQLRISNVYKDSVITTITFARDSLQRVVDAVPAPPKEPFIPKLTRKQVFIGGTIIGTVAGWILKTVLVP